LKIEDVITIRFPYQERLDQRLGIQPDGNVRCLLLGQVRAAGRTAGDLEEQLRRGYARYIRDPEMTVIVESANQKITELKKAITTAPRGQSRLVPIKPDGTIDLPYVGEVLVAGKTVNQAKRLLDQLYAENDLQEVEVTVQTLEFAPKRIFVMGEVYSPGMFESVAPVTLIQSIIRMGGPNPRADRAKVLLVRRQFLPLPQAVVFDMNHVMTQTRPTPNGRVPRGSEFRWDMYLADGDIVYVPPTGLAQATDWIDQVFTRGVRAVFPYSGVLGMNFGYQIYQADSTITTRQFGSGGRLNTIAELAAPR
jgi:polysaccharide export outer membrane protein